MPAVGRGRIGACTCTHGSAVCSCSSSVRWRGVGLRCVSCAWLLISSGCGRVIRVHGLHSGLRRWLHSSREVRRCGWVTVRHSAEQCGFDGEGVREVGQQRWRARRGSGRANSSSRGGHGGRRAGRHQRVADQTGQDHNVSRAIDVSDGCVSSEGECCVQAGGRGGQVESLDQIRAASVAEARALGVG